MYVTLANALGISVEQLEAALEEESTVREFANSRGIDIGEIRLALSKAYRRVVLCALNEGILTREKADKLLACKLNEVDLLSECLRSAGNYKERLHAAAAEALQLSVKDLETAFSQGQTLRQIAEGRDVDMAAVRSAMKGVHQEQIRHAVDSGELSPTQAKQLQEQFTLAPWLAEDELPDSAPLLLGLERSRMVP